MKNPMDKFILVYITCESREQAEDIGRHLLSFPERGTMLVQWEG